MPNDQPLRDPKDPHNFPEDYIYKNGKYANRCIECGSHFVGHKRRSLCHLCNRHPMEVIDFPNVQDHLDPKEKDMSMTIGELISNLKMVKKQDSPIYFDFCGCEPTTVGSWRGIYAEPALGWCATGYSANPHQHKEGMTVSALIVELEASLGREYTGWKGGDYTYHKGDTLHIDNPGDCTHTELVHVDDDGYSVVLRTRYERS